MHERSILDLGSIPEFASEHRHRSPFAAISRSKGALVAVLTGAIVGGGAFAIGPAMRAAGLYASEGEAVIRIPLDDLRRVEAMNVDDAAQIVVKGSDAQRRNAALPVSDRPLEHVSRFMIAGDRAKVTALKCLTQAIYYEGAFEPLPGRRAVAQVVLNRMRHPAYPKSVCGVVYQGSERRTGCQFSFTCDGSLLRRPSPGAWREAEEVARAALAGHVEESVGTATHYHADYVLPKWAFQLGKITQLGRHIFYRFNGNWGRSAAFSGRYSGIEQIPAMDIAALSLRLAEQGTADQGNVTPGLTVTPHITDRHSATDVGGRLDTTKEWRLTIPDPTDASSRYRRTITETSQPAPAQVAIAENRDQEVGQ